MSVGGLGGITRSDIERAMRATGVSPSRTDAAALGDITRAEIESAMRATGIPIPKAGKRRAPPRRASFAPPDARDRSDVATGKRLLPVSQLPARELLRKLPEAAQADVTGSREKAQAFTRLARTNPTAAGFLGDRGAYERAHSDPRTFVAKAVADRLEKYRRDVARVEAEAPAQSKLSGLAGRAKTPQQAQAQAFAKIGSPDESFIGDAMKVVNAPFSAAGNLIAGRPGEAARNLIGRGRQTTPGAELFGEGSSKAAAFDFASAFLGTPELAPLRSVKGARAARAASLESTGRLLRSVRSLTPEEIAATEAYLPGGAAVAERVGARVPEARPGKPAEPSEAQRRAFDRAFTHAGIDELLGAHADVAAARQAAKRRSASGVRVSAPFTGHRVGVDVPVVPAKAAQALRRFAERSGVGDVDRWWRHHFVSQYGPNPIAGAAARAADTWTLAANRRALRRVLDEAKGTIREERQQAVRYIEGTLRKGEEVAPHVAGLADRLSAFVDDLTGEYLRAGGDLQRLDAPYVFHALGPKDAERLARDERFASKSFGHGPSFARQRSRPGITVEGLKHAGYDPLDDLVEIAYARAAAHNRAMADLRLVRHVADRAWEPGEPVVPIPSPFARPGDVVPESVAETLGNVAAARARFPTTKVMRSLRDANSRFKQAALATTGYDIRNQIGDMILLAQAGHDPLRAIGRGAKVLAGKGKAGGLPAADVRLLADVQGVTQSGTLARDVRAHLGPEPSAQTERGALTPSLLRSPGRALGAARRGRENLNRAGAFAGLLKSEGAVLAAERVNRALYDYGDVGRAVEALRSSPVGAPFVTWLAKNVPAQVRHAAGRPRNLLLLGQAQQQLAEQSGFPNPLILSEFSRRQVPIPVPGVGWVTFGAPQADLERFGPLLRGQFGKATRDLLANTGPVPQALMGSALGINPLTGAAIPDRVPATASDSYVQAIPGLGRLLLGPPDAARATDAEGAVFGAPGVSGRGAALLRQINPALSTYGRLGGDPRSGKGFAETLRDIGLGARVTPFHDRHAIAVAVNARIAQIFDARRSLRGHVQAKELAGQPYVVERLPEYRQLQRAVAELEQLQALLEGA